MLIKPNGRPEFVIGFQGDFDKGIGIKDWEWDVEHRWDHLRSDDNPTPFSATQFEQADPVETQ